jgi:putative transposase
MGRPLRIEYPDAFYHITARGNERQNIFRSNRDRERFLGYFDSATERYKAIIHAYCLMDNHYHLLLQTPGGNLSQIMHHINGAYTNYFNKKRERSGHLFQGRYKALLVDIDEYAQELSRYIHLNPVRAGMIENPEQFKWTSYRYYIGLKESPKWLFTDFILNLFNRNASTAKNQYRMFVESIVDMVVDENPFKNVFASTILGGRSFINEIRERHLGKKKPDRDLPDLNCFLEIPDLEQIIEQTAAVFGEDTALLKKVQIYLCHKFSGQKLKDIGMHFGIGLSGVSQASRRVALQIKEDKRLRKKVNKVILALGLSNV